MAVTMLRVEASAAQVGRETVQARLGDALLVQMVRSWFQQTSRDADSAAAFGDRQIGSVLLAIHADPAAPWSLMSMASVAALSRSRFVERFRELVGVPPMTYLTELRLDTARALLLEGQSVRGVSRATGYGSEQAFSRAFTRRHGIPPSRAAEADSTRAAERSAR
jgi:transcriptional regulator GlxA family with amidase domain